MSDIHANVVALEAVLSQLPPVDEIRVMGDTVGYGPDPSDVIALLRERDAEMVAGNHDLAVATGEGLEFFNPVAREAANLHRSWLSQEELDLLAALPAVAHGADVTFFHGSLRDPNWEYVRDARAADATLLLAQTAMCCNGHTHLPALFSRSDGRTSRLPLEEGVANALGEKVLINPGSVGQPRDHDPRAAWALLDTGERTVTFARVEYDIGETQRRMRNRRLPEFLIERLAHGI